ncbi:ABC transporter permease [Microbacterium sp. 18062]|uniref:ABC transporter permease n=1 Tax=Microbacterium sp. 18062 TaxID=2681410 RepID=UPI0013597337|nr:ABC transporter permease subunit [Microbacterium sp. 18062]
MSVLRAVAARGRAPREGVATTGTRGVVVTVLVVALVLVVWQVATTVAGTSGTVLPGPVAIVAEADWMAVLAAAGVTVLSTFLGFIAGNLLGLVLAIAVTSSRLLSDLVYPLAVFVRSIPIVALAPFLILLFGRGAAASTVVAALIVFFPTLVNVILGLRSVPAEALELTRVINAPTWFQYVHVRIPFALPSFVSALKISAPSAVLGVMTAEWIIGGSGLGRLVIQSWLTLQVPTMWGAVVFSAVVAWLLFSAVGLLERMLLGWAVRT